jgi:hypothetical protein
MSTLRSNTIQTVNSLDSLLFSTNATERMRVSSDGNVGIGTRNPSCALDVNGTVKSTTIHCTGNVGIGTANPSVALHVVGTVKNTNPVFEVSYSTTPPVVGFTASAGELVWNSETLDTAGAFNTGNGRFTAPVAGVYFFSANLFFTISGNTANNSYGFWYFAKNGAQSSQVFHGPNTGASNRINYTSISGSYAVTLAATETISVYYKGSPYSTGYSNFNGQFIG